MGKNFFQKEQQAKCEAPTTLSPQHNGNCYHQAFQIYLTSGISLSECALLDEFDTENQSWLS